jgi:integrase
MKSVKARAMVALAIVAGMRRGELLALRWRCLNASNSQVQISEAAYLGELGTPKTDAGARTVNVDPRIFPLLEEWRSKSKRTRPDDFIFGTRTGELENPNNILRRHIYLACDQSELHHCDSARSRRVRENLGIVKISFHFFNPV